MFAYDIHVHVHAHVIRKIVPTLKVKLKEAAGVNYM